MKVSKLMEPYVERQIIFKYICKKERWYHKPWAGDGDEFEYGYFSLDGDRFL